MKKILITSGGTREYIDDVRVLTNISSGRLGAIIAAKFADDYNGPHSYSRYTEYDKVFNYEVHYVYAKGAELPITQPYGDSTINPEIIFHEVTDVSSLMKTMEELVPQMDVVIHSMAVSDFGFYSVDSKLKSSDTDAFIQSLKQRIYKNPKVLSFIKTWNPNCFLISFKFEVGLEHEELIKIACQSMAMNRSDVVVANDKKEMVDNKKHIAYILEYVKPVEQEEMSEMGFEGLQGFTVRTSKAESKEEIAESLFSIVKKL